MKVEDKLEFSDQQRQVAAKKFLRHAPDFYLIRQTFIDLWTAENKRGIQSTQ
jgi:hypothetical protein